MRILSFPEFQSYLRRLLRLGSDATLGAEEHLIDDVGLDSLGMAELAAALDETGVRLLEEILLELETVGDAYHYYESQAQRLASNADAWAEAML